MGNSKAKIVNLYNLAVKNDDRKNNETFIYQNPNKNQLKYKYNTLQEMMKSMFQKNSKTKTIFEYRLNNKHNQLSRKINKISLNTFKNDAEFFGSGLLNLDLIEWKKEYKNFKLRFLGIYACNSYKYFVHDLSCIMYNIVSVPIYDTLGEEATNFIFQDTNLETLCITVSHLKNMFIIKQSGKLPNLKNFIIIDEQNFNATHEASAEKAGIVIYKWSEIIEAGKSDKMTSWEKVEPNDIYCFSYTSGTTGKPKGSMLTQNNLATTIASMSKEVKFRKNEKHLSYLPLAHIMEKVIALTFITHGHTIAIFSSDIVYIKSDLNVFKPTIFISVPRLYNKFYDVFQEKISEIQGTFKGNLVNKAVNKKLFNLEKYGKLKHTFYDAIVFKKMKKALGGKVRLMLSGSAPLNKDVADFLKIAMSCPLVEGYGQTEGTGAEFGMKINDTISGHVGGVLYHNEFKLVDVPEMKYFSSDKWENTFDEAPRGEIWVRGKGVIAGYYKNDNKNAETFTKDGWLMSGDIGMICPPNNRLVIIDRKKNIFKLSQGEYIIPEKLENAYKTCIPLINDIFIYGDSLKNSILAIVTVEKKNISKLIEFLKLNKIKSNIDNLNQNVKFEKAIISLFKKKAKKSKFISYEIPKRIIISDELFVDLGLLTTSFKMKRNLIKEHFQAQISNKYKGLN